MSMHRAPSPTDRRSSSAPRAPGARARLLRISLAAALGVFAALLVACSGSGRGLIPTGDSGPLQGDFEAVARAAENGNGDCASTESALLKTDQDFAALPASIDAGLHNTLRQGIENLRTRGLALCAQPLAQATETTTTPKTTTSTPTTTTPTETQTTPTTPSTTPTTSGPGGGTPAPGEGGEEEGPGLGKGEGGGKGHNGRGDSGGTQPEAGGQEASK
ncbi:MAG: hypothetical protein QOE67_803 [Solirubrobacteraceae bacterium]|nr:hypothetical protein [Solirubrobacteraceae bacterium]